MYAVYMSVISQQNWAKNAIKKKKQKTALRRILAVPRGTSVIFS